MAMPRSAPRSAAEVMSPEPAMESERTFFAFSVPRTLDLKWVEPHFSRVRILSVPFSTTVSISAKSDSSPSSTSASLSPCTSVRYTGAESAIASNPATGRASRRSAAASGRLAQARRRQAMRRAMDMVFSFRRFPFDGVPASDGFAGGADAEGGADLERHGKRALERRLAHGDVAHLAPGPRLALAVEVQMRAGMREHRLPARLAAVVPGIAEEIHHHRGRVLRRIAQRKPAQHAHLLLELRRAAR